MYIVAYKIKGNDKATKLDKVIAKATSGGLVHTELCFKINSSLMGECFSVSPRENKGRYKHIKLDPQRWEIYRFTNCPENTKEALRKESAKYLGFKYDWLGAIFSVLNSKLKSIGMSIQIPSRIFCSEVCAMVIKACLYKPKQLPAHYYPTLLIEELLEEGLIERVEMKDMSLVS